MNRCIRHCKFSIPGFLTFCAIFANTGMAQQESRVSAFTTCVESTGAAYLCTLHSWDLAFGYSASEPGNSAYLIMGSLNEEGQECVQASTPSSLDIRLSNPDLRPGDRIYLEDFIIEAFDEVGNFIPEIPVIV